jgi:hypothetical protein
MTLTFRCAPELAGILLPPIPAVEGLPGWLKAMPLHALNSTGQGTSQTLKRCPPFIDSMTYGFLMRLPCDLKVENGEFSWTFDVPGGGPVGFLRSPIGFHDPAQAAGSPLFNEDQFIIKFNNFWTIKSPPGYSLLFTHPVNRPDLPFTTFTGLVDSDTYNENWIHFPAHWQDTNFNGILPRGTPVAQCIPVKREKWSARVETMSDEDTKRLYDLTLELGRETGIYRQQFRAAKR